MPKITITLIKTKETEEYLEMKIPEYIEMQSKLNEEELEELDVDCVTY